MIVAVVCGMTVLGAQVANAQSSDEPSGPAALPRPGYDRAAIRMGPTALRLDFDLSALYDSNVYATHDAVRDDMVLHAGFRAGISDDRANRQLHGEAYVERNQHVDVGRETSTSFGALLRAKVQAAREQDFTGTLRYDRAIESRSDPEARASTTLSPRKIDIFAAEGAYGYHPSRLGFDLSGAVRSYDFLDPNEHDRDMRSYQGSFRVSWRFTAPLSLFIEPYAARRDFVTRVDLSGVNRDATTAGALFGVSHNATAAITGRIGVGFFRFMPDAATLRPFTGFAANGEITWSPRRRTAITATIFSGDVATVRAGATGRHDTNLNLRVDQEAYHNLLLNAALSWTQAKYRNAASADRNTLALQAGATYLVNSTVSLFGQATIAHRTAPFDINSFNRRTVSIGIRFHQ
jgi:hypothetical protein